MPGALPTMASKARARSMAETLDMGWAVAALLPPEDLAGVSPEFRLKTEPAASCGAAEPGGAAKR